MVEHSAVNRVVVGSSPTRGVHNEGNRKAVEDTARVFLNCVKCNTDEAGKRQRHEAPWSSG